MENEAYNGSGYVPEPPRNLKADEREWVLTLPPCPPGHHVEIELPGHHGARDPVVRIVEDPKSEEGSNS